MPDSRDPTGAEPRSEDASANAPPVAGWIRPYFTDSALWPVLFVLVATLVLFGAVVLLLALRERRYFAVAALLVLAWASADGFRSDHRRGGFGIASGLILALWLLSGLVAFAAAHFDLF